MNDGAIVRSQASGLLGVPRHAAQNLDQVGMLAGGNGHLFH